MQRAVKPSVCLDWESKTYRIAAIARAAGAVLVTAEAAFKNVPGLLVEDWTRPFTP